MKRRLIALGKEREYLFVIVAKDKQFFSWLGKLLYNSFNIIDADKIEYEDKRGNWVSKKKDINKYIDEHESYYGFSNNARIDIFYGLKKIFITVYGIKKDRECFLKNIEKYSKWKSGSRKSRFWHPFWK